MTKTNNKMSLSKWRK